MFADLARYLLAKAAPGGGESRLSVLIFHRVLERPDPLLPNEPSADEFERTMRWAKSAFNVIALSDGVRGLRDGKLPERPLAITFDDGYANNATVAAPILERLALPATFFIATGYLDGGRMFNDTVIEAVRGTTGPVLDLEPLGLGRHPLATDADRRRTIGSLLNAIRDLEPRERTERAERIAEAAGGRSRRDLMMTSEQAAQMARSGFELGGHTVTHPILARLSDDAARREIEDGRRRLEEIAGTRVRLFAFPNGRPDVDYTARTVELVRDAGFAGAVTTSPGAACVGSDPLQIPRFTPWETRTMRFTARMWDNLVRTEPRYAAA